MFSFTGNLLFLGTAVNLNFFIFIKEPFSGVSPSILANQAESVPSSLSVTRDLKQIGNWWKKWPNAMIGTNLGMSNRFVIDIDNHKVNGLENWHSLGISDEGCQHVMTPSGGLHLYFSGQGRASTNEKLGIDTSYEIFCDSSEPRSIEELYRCGFNAKPVKKGPDSIRFGISVLQNYKLHILKTSTNLINEMYGYQYATDKHGYTTDTPEGGLDHLLDAARYVAMMKLTQKAVRKGSYAITIR